MTHSSLPADRPTHFRWTVLGLACGTSWILYLHRYTFALIKPFLTEEYGLTNTQLGFFDSLFKVCYTGFQVPCGILADVIGIHLFLFVAICVWSLGLEGHALAPGWKSLVAARAMLGMGQAGCFAALNRLTKNWFPVQYRTTVQGFVGVFFGRAGGASANILVLTVLIGVFAFSWRTAILVLVVLGAVQAVLVLVLLRDRPQQHPWVNDAEVRLIAGPQTAQADANPPVEKAVRAQRQAHDERLPSWREIYRGMSSRSLFNLGALNTQSILSTAADSIYSLWIPSFLAQVHHLDFKEMGIYSALPLIGGAFGGGIGGLLNDVVIRKTASRRWGRTSVAFAGKTMAGVILVTAIL